MVKQELNRKIKYLEQQLKDMNDSQIPHQKQETQESNREKEIFDSIDSNFSETTSAFDKNQSSDHATDDTTNRQIDVNDIDIVTKPQYDKIGDFQNGLAKVKLNGKWGFIDKNSNFYDEVGEFFNGLAKIKLNDKWGFVNASGDVIIELMYDEAGDFNYQWLAKVKLNGKWGFIDKNGKFCNERPIINF